VSVSEIAGYAYCPRSWWYDTHPPAEGRTAESARQTRDGVRYHARVLSTDRRRVFWARVGCVVVATATLLLIAGSLLGWWSA
jgi:hypothetical protein